jgi:hypothetical protein
MSPLITIYNNPSSGLVIAVLIKDLYRRGRRRAMQEVS